MTVRSLPVPRSTSGLYAAFLALALAVTTDARPVWSQTVAPLLTNFSA